MENENLPFNNEGGDLEGVDETTLPEDYSEEETGGDEPTHDSTEKSTATLDEERRRAITASIAKAKEAEQARTEAEVLRLENQVLRNPESIIELAQTDPQLAEKISSQAFGKSLSEVRQILASQNESTPSTDTDFRKVYREERERERRAEELQRINRLESDFFFQKNIDPTHPKFTAIMQTYNKFKPSSYEEAEELLEMAYAKHVKTSGTKVNDSSAIPSIRSNASTPSKKPKNALSSNALALAKSMGLTDKYLK